MSPGAEKTHSNGSPVPSPARREDLAQWPDLSEMLAASRPFRQVLLELERGTGQPLLGGVVGSLLSVLVTSLFRHTHRRWVVVVPGEEEADGLFADLGLMGVPEGQRLLLPAHRDEVDQRAQVVAGLSQPDVRVLVAAVRSVVDPVPDPRSVTDSRLHLAVGALLPQDQVVPLLLGAGLVRESLVDRPGLFSVRGDLMDFWPTDQSQPLRVEWLDDAVEGIRRFDPGTQLSVQVLPAVTPTLLRRDGEETGILADHLGEGWTLITRDAAALEEALSRHLDRFEGAARRAREEAWGEMQRCPRVATSRLKAPAAEAVNLGGQVITPRGTGFGEAVETLESVARGKGACVVCFDTEAERRRFMEVVGDHLREAGRRPLGSGVVPVVGRVHEGFHSPLLGLGVVGHQELFAHRTARRRPAPVAKDVVSAAIDTFLDLAEGDYVVHVVHGIARFLGLRREKKGESEQDFLVLLFKDDVNLHVPTSKIDLVQKYVGGKGEAPELSKLGSSSFEKRKEAVQRAVMDMAADLLEVHALRAQRPGIQHPSDSPWQQEFEAAFPHQPTPDQARAVEAIKADMESPRPMDRLICGDVGYGKTEVAIRAAFKCVMGNRQVAVLVPTTVLAQQHEQSFRGRMQDYPVTIESLSRFRTASEQSSVLAGLADGSVDIVIGTHRLLQQDVAFKDLGLLVIDEEQRFGVAHKERLRRLRSDVDVLTLSATPIPRTLHQAMLGIRDISPLTQPPFGRREVRTEVIPFDERVVTEAIRRELDREGQVFFVHNRIDSLYPLAANVQKWVPHARVAVAHGQMGERALEQAMIAFLSRQADVLVSTTIVESGLDIPTANTIFVDQADLYGLSELHQLRGRVGRYHQQAYAYFLVREDLALSDVAEKRLRAIEEFSKLGAGFQIAMRDLEIRGAGNILGPEQSGHIAAVGYELYCRLLDAAVRRLKNERVVMPEDVEINLDFQAYIPETWVPEAKVRVEIYRKLGRAATEAQFAGLLGELRDRFGPPPPEAQEFVLMAKIRALLEHHRIGRLEIMKGVGPALHPRRMQRLLSQVGGPGDRVRVLGGKIVVLVHPEPFRGPGDLYRFLCRWLPEPGDPT